MVSVLQVYKVPDMVVDEVADMVVDEVANTGADMEVDKVADMVVNEVNEVADTLTHYGSVICQAFIQKLALSLYWYWVLGIGLPGYSNYIYYMVDMW